MEESIRRLLQLIHINDHPSFYIQLLETQPSSELISSPSGRSSPLLYSKVGPSIAQWLRQQGKPEEQVETFLSKFAQVKDYEETQRFLYIFYKALTDPSLGSVLFFNPDRKLSAAPTSVPVEHSPQFSLIPETISSTGAFSFDSAYQSVHTAHLVPEPASNEAPSYPHPPSSTVPSRSSPLRPQSTHFSTSLSSAPPVSNSLDRPGFNYPNFQQEDLLSKRPQTSHGSMTKDAVGQSAASRLGKKTYTDLDLSRLTARLNNVTKLNSAEKVQTSTPVNPKIPLPQSASVSTIAPGTAFSQAKSYQAPIDSTRKSSKNEIADQGIAADPTSIPSSILEYSLCQDLLYVLLGCGGNYIHKITGFASTLLRFESLDTPLFVMDSRVDASLGSLASHFIPIASHYAFLAHVVEVAMAYHYGFVIHALSEKTREYLQDYYIFVAQLERQILRSDKTIGLHQIWSWVSEVGRTIGYLAEAWHLLIFHPGNAEGNGDRWLQGGEALNCLYRHMALRGGDMACREIFQSLLERASVPYLKILHGWINYGEIKDPYGEFLIVETATIKKEDLRLEYNDAYWESRFRIRGDTRGSEMPITSLEELRLAFHDAAPKTKDVSEIEHVPYFVKGLEEKVLLSGKYWNVMRDCRCKIMPWETRKLIAMEYKVDSLSQKVDLSYREANREVLNLLFKENHLMTRLRSLKHFFFVDQGDFLVHFLDLAFSELRKPAREISTTTLQSLLDLVLRNPSSTSAASTDPYKDDVKVELSSMGLTEQLLRIMSITGALEDEFVKRMEEIPNSTESRSHVHNGFNSFTLDYNVPFPLSLVINKRSLTRYQIIFRYIFTFKYVERQLSSAWYNHHMGYKSFLKWLNNPGNDAVDDEAIRQLNVVMAKAYHLRAQMLVFVQNIAYYVFNEVLESRWSTLEQQLLKANTVDEVLSLHADFLDTCLKDCMLTNKKLLMSQMQILNACASFAMQTDRFMRAFLVSPAVVMTASLRSPLETYIHIVDKASNIFEKELSSLMENIHYLSAMDGDHRLPHLAVRLDYTGFYAGGHQRMYSQEGTV